MSTWLTKFANKFIGRGNIDLTLRSIQQEDLPGIEMVGGNTGRVTLSGVETYTKPNCKTQFSLKAVSDGERRIIFSTTTLRQANSTLLYRIS